MAFFTRRRIKKELESRILNEYPDFKLVLNQARNRFPNSISYDQWLDSALHHLEYDGFSMEDYIESARTIYEIAKG